MNLTENQKKHLRRLGHALDPIVLLGQRGLTDAVVREMAQALADHELVKARAPGIDRDQRDATLAALAERTDSTLVQRIGHVGLFFRPNPKLSRIVLPGR
jgi:RNA-binding protein